MFHSVISDCDIGVNVTLWEHDMSQTLLYIFRESMVYSQVIHIFLLHLYVLLIFFIYYVLLYFIINVILLQEILLHCIEFRAIT